MVFPAQFNLSDLDGSNGFVINGIDSGDYSGRPVSSAGDINGDGVDDLILGTLNTEESYVVFGSEGGFNQSLDLSSLNGSNGFIINGIDSGDNFGRSLSNAGDINNDGVDDLIIGASGADPNGNNSAGESYVVFGSGSGFGQSLDISSLDGSNGFTINGIDSADNSGTSVSNAGDINGDGIDDIIIGARGADPNGSNSGESYVVFGSEGGFSQSLDLSSLDGSNGFAINGIDAGDYSGNSVSSAGDINGDGIDDIIVGASGTDFNGTYDLAESYVVFGSNSFGASLELSSLNGSNGFTITGINADESLTGSVSSAGDINGDGIDDIIIGSPGAKPNGNYDIGESYVVFGSNSFGASLDVASLNGSNGFILNGIDELDRSGTSISSAGDVNSDGIDDLIVGAPGADPNGNNSAGESYVVYGNDGFGASLDLSSLDGSNGFTINGIDGSDYSSGNFAADYSGDSVSSAGDINGDGIDDMIIGALGADPNGNNSAGESYVVFGAEPTSDLLDISITETKEITSYGGAAQNPDITVSTSDNNTEIQLEGNGWRRLDITGFEVTEDTILNFNFKGNGESEIQGIGFDNNNNISTVDDGGNFFQVDGSQNFGIDELDQFIVGTTDGFSQYSIPVGEFFTGEFDFLTIANDDDQLNPNAVAQFQNIELA